MSAAPLAIAVISPHAWPPRDDVAAHVAAEAAALAGRGHRVTLLAPASGGERLARGRALLRARASGDAGALLAAPGEVREVAVGRALPSARGLGGPREVAAGLEAALAGTPFDVVHLHEPLAPSPALAALRHASGITVATFHRPEQLAGVAFLRPLVDRALARCDLRIATSPVARRAIAEVLPGAYLVVPPGIDPALVAPPADEADGAPGVVLIARGRERAGARFVLSVVRGLDLDALGPVTLLGPAEAPWRTHAAVPKALRDRIATVADTGPEARAAALARGRIALLATPEDAAGPALRDALAAGMAVLAPRCPELDALVRHGEEALVLPPFSREAWMRETAAIAADPLRRRALGARAARQAGARPWSAVAADLEDAYRRAIAESAAGPHAEERIAADLRVRVGAGLDAEALVAACRRSGIGAIVAAGRGGLAPALEVAAAAPHGLAVVVGQEIATRDGCVVGLFLTRGVPDGLPLAETADRIAKQGGLLMVPHPDATDAPPPEALRAARVRPDLHEVLTPSAGPPAAAEDVARAAQRLGVPACAGSGAERPEDVGAVTTHLRPFAGPEDLLDALAGALLVHRRAAGRSRRPRGRPHAN